MHELDTNRTIAWVLHRHVKAYVLETEHNPNAVPLWECVQSELKQLYRIKVTKRMLDRLIPDCIKVASELLL